MTKRIDEIVEKAYKYLDKFYESYGEEIPQRKSPTREKTIFDNVTYEENIILHELKKKNPGQCKQPGCTEIPKKGNRFCSLHFSKPVLPKFLSPKIPSKPAPLPKPPITKPVTKPTPQPFSIENWSPPAPVKEKLSLNIKGLSSREIVELIKKETGEAITICLKSKQNVIRHAKIILKKKGMRLYE
jgi:hypothetical protein